eukprot:m.105559 g.105559  ORF g.105559 m.105559 type:complete len:254 (-) comp22499_c0_seq1:122-883(-)
MFLCNICLDGDTNERVVELKRCGHLFHFRCIDGWQQQRNCCPTCRAVISLSFPTTLLKVIYSDGPISDDEVDGSTKWSDRPRHAQLTLRPSRSSLIIRESATQSRWLPWKTQKGNAVERGLTSLNRFFQVSDEDLVCLVFRKKRDQKFPARLKGAKNPMVTYVFRTSQGDTFCSALKHQCGEAASKKRATSAPARSDSTKSSSDSTSSSSEFSLSRRFTFGGGSSLPSTPITTPSITPAHSTVDLSHLGTFDC